LGTVLSLIVTVIFATGSLSVIDKLVVNFGAVLLTALAAVTFAKFYRVGKPPDAGSDGVKSARYIADPPH